MQAYRLTGIQAHRRGGVGEYLDENAELHEAVFAEETPQSLDARVGAVSPIHGRERSEGRQLQLLLRR